MKNSQLLTNQIERTRDWTLALLEDFDGGDWTFQITPGAQHALWIAGHLACAQELLLFQRSLGRPRLDPAFMAHFPIGAAVPSAEQQDWPPAQDVRRVLADMQQATVAAVAGLSDALLAEPAYGKDGSRHPHYDTKMEAISHLVRHEAFHAGQLAVIRRALAKPFLR